MPNEINPSCNVILSGAKLQRSRRRRRGQAFNLWNNSQLPPNDNSSEMFESLASCFAFRCIASLNMTHPLFLSCQKRFQASV